MSAHLIASIVGIWLMAASAILGYGEPAATNDRIVGPLVASFALISVWHVTRTLRWPNVALAVWLLAAPVLLGYPSIAAANSIACGLVIGTLSLVRGKQRHSVGGGWSSLRRGASSSTA